ncbi:hypothetical protein [Paraburkholderia sediminicola]|uniref:hypothetical protein n=1 Tax=Paraburkholderia sediminicola TaxID=458836 RepID=UPI0038B7FF58
MRVVSLHPLALGSYRDPFLFVFPGLASFVYPAPPRDEGGKRERSSALYPIHDGTLKETHSR